MKTPLRLAALLAVVAASGVARAEPVTVFAAASVTNAMEEIGELFREKGEEAQFSFASSSTLARQIEAGAPAQIFVSANEEWMDYLAERDLIEPATRVSPISNRLVLIAPSDSDLTSIEITGSTDFASPLGSHGRLAVGDPEHVPAGIYAKQALERLGAWTSLEPRLARADNVRAALALVETGEAPLGIVYSTDAAASTGVKVIGTFPPTSHDAITYPFAIVKDPGGGDVIGEEAKALFSLMTGTEGLAIFARYGFATD